jgi:hypothetical protein
MLSALDELCRKKELKRPDSELAEFLEANFYEFETAIENDIILQRDVIKSERTISLVGKILDETENRVNLIQNSIKANAEQLLANEEDTRKSNMALQKLVDDKKADIAKDIDSMSVEAKRWVNEFLERVKSEIESIGTTVSVNDLERHFQFYMSDLTKNAILSCTERHQKDISDKLTDFSNSISQEITQNAFGAVNAKIASSISDISWTGLELISFTFAVGVEILGPVMLIGQVIAGFLRQSKAGKKQADFLAPILQGFHTIVSDTVTNMDTIYEQLKLSAIDKIEELFRNQLDVSMEAIVQARQIAADEEVKSEEVVQYLESLLVNIEEFREVINKYK